MVIAPSVYCRYRYRSIKLHCDGMLQQNMICAGFDDANQKREMKESLHPTCLFWRHPLPELHEEANMNAMKRIEARRGLSWCI